MDRQIEHLFQAPSQSPAYGTTGFFSSSPVPIFFGKARPVTKEQIQSARISDLYHFLRTHHGDLFKEVGTCLSMRGKDSIYIKKGFPGYNDFKNNAHGNSIDFLVHHLGYSFVDAVIALNAGNMGTAFPAGHNKGACNAACGSALVSKSIELPQPAPYPHKKLFAYLVSRAIPCQIVQRLEKQGLLYQERFYNNAVFVNPQKDYCELRGTFSYASHPFHGCLKSRPDRFWYMKAGEGIPQTAYICEGAIDAVSLFLLRQMADTTENAVYISIGGVSNQQTIDRIKKRVKTILAVDNDHAGLLCRERNPDLEAIIPNHKDWNDDLQISMGRKP